MLAGERGQGRLRRLKRALVARRARMVAQLAAAFGLGFQTGASLDSNTAASIPVGLVLGFASHLCGADCPSLSWSDKPFTQGGHFSESQTFTRPPWLHLTA